MTRILVVWCLLCGVAEARVDRIQIVSQEDVAGGKSFGAAGPYERVRARVFYALDPMHPRNRAIVDLDKAAKNAKGEVEFAGDVDILRPKRGGGEVVFVNAPNRGQRALIRDQQQDEWYIRQGFTIVELAWQFDIPADPALMHFDAPIARGVRGSVRSDFIVTLRTPTHTIGHSIMGTIGGEGYRVADRATATLTERDGSPQQRSRRSSNASCSPSISPSCSSAGARSTTGR